MPFDPTTATRDAPEGAFDASTATPDAPKGPSDAPYDWANAPGATVGRFVRGAGRGLAGLLTSIPDPDLPGIPESAREARRQGKQQVRDWATAPVPTTSEELGRMAGEVGPFLLQPEVGAARAAAAYGGRVVPALGRIAERAIQGATAGAAQPTEGSHLAGAAAGAAGAVVAPGLTGSGLPGRFAGHAFRHATIVPLAAAVARMGEQAGIPFHYTFWPAWHALHQALPTLSSLTARLPASVRRGARRVAAPFQAAAPSTAGAIGGQAVSQHRPQGFDLGTATLESEDAQAQVPQSQ